MTDYHALVKECTNCQVGADSQDTERVTESHGVMRFFKTGEGGQCRAAERVNDANKLSPAANRIPHFLIVSRSHERYVACLVVSSSAPVPRPLPIPGLSNLSIAAVF